MIFYDFSISPSNNAPGSADKIVDFIQESTGRVAFDSECRKYKDYTLSSGSKNQQTALGKSALVGNVALIDHIMQKEDPSSLPFLGTTCLTPLHCAIKCENKEKGHQVAKRLIQFRAPINIVTEVFYGKSYSMTPLEMALKEGNIPIAATLLRAGGIVREEFRNPIKNPEVPGNLKKAEELIELQNQKAIFFKLQHQKTVPKEIINSLLSLYMKLI